MEHVTITVIRQGREQKLTVKPGSNLLEALVEHDIYISAACGGKGRCGKCGVQMLEGATEVNADDRRFYNEEELAEGWRLSCLSHPETDCRIVIETGDEADFEIVSDYQDEKRADAREAVTERCDIGIDIGSTTIAMSLVGRESKKVLHTETLVNHQRAYGADVISRIQASNDGKKEELKKSIRRDLYDGITRIYEQMGIGPEQIGQIVIAGNTTMGHLLMGFSCEGLGVFPFTPVDIGTIHTTYGELFGSLDEKAADIAVVLVPGISTFVGADISSGMLSCGFDRTENVNILVDLGTNGEMAIGNKDRILVTSTAAGPAFEGGNISCGMGSVQGAICKVEIEGTDVHCSTIGEKPMIGLCGTGVIETTYELLQKEWIDETGMLEEDFFEDGFVLGQTPEGEDISFTQKDVREIQLAKSAVRAGLETLMLRYGVTYEDIDTLYLAGGFGYKINLKKAAGIGLLPEELLEKTVAVGNSSLGGTITYLTEADAKERLDRIVACSEEVALASDPKFNQFYTDYMFFE